MNHWGELRRRLLLTCAAMLALMVLLFIFKEAVLNFLLQPLHGTAVQTTAVAELFFTYLRVAGWGGFLLALPLFFWQIWAFLAPGLYAHERRVLWPALAAVPVLFYAGAAFAFYALVPLVLDYLLGFAQPGVLAQPRLADYLGFLFTLLGVVGAAFNLPVVLVLSMALGFITPAQLAAARRWVIVGVFVVAAFATPPDPLSQTVLAVPLLLLYEAAILSGKLLEKQRKKG
ncbi:MAG: twin-arginine translocase subunit TatC [Alphaproteobacteria bacterium]|nr:twin-arginine translocase subunit TatC [Alphaproteobacteria bacterium]